MGGGEDAAVPVHNHLGGFLQIPDPAVIAKAFPELVKQIIVAVCQGGNIGEYIQKTGIVPFDSFHTGLLLGSGKEIKVNLPKIKNREEYIAHVYEHYFAAKIF